MDDVVMPSPPRRTWLRPARVWLALGAALVVIVAAVQVTITDPRVQIRWREGVSSADRTAVERRYELRNGVPAGDGWRYELGDLSRENIRALIQDPAVDDTGYIDRDALTSEGRDIRVTIWHPFSDLFDRPSQLLQLHQSLWLLLAGGVLLRAARASSARCRRNMTVATLLLVGVMTVAFPIDPSFVTMGEWYEHGQGVGFEVYYLGRVRFEKHLSQTILVQFYQQFGQTPEQAFVAVSRGAAAWFVLSALAIGVLERWSTVVLRYLGLALLAPSALLYFGWREFGYLSLNVAVFPLLVRGLRDGGWRLEAGSAVAGLGAALHGTGLVALAGAWLAAVGTNARLMDRVVRALRVVAWGTSAYLGWIAVYIIVLKLPIATAETQYSYWRPWFVDEIRGGVVSAALLSVTGARDLLMTAWVVGALLLVVALSLGRQYAHEVRTMLYFVLPSILFVTFRWPLQGLGGGMDLIFGGFPALYALAWLCAHDSKRTKIAAALLVSAHLAFWRIVLDAQFMTTRIDTG